MKKFFGTFSGLRQEDGIVLELGMLHTRLEEKVARIPKPTEYSPEFIPVSPSRHTFSRIIPATLKVLSFFLTSYIVYDI
jgi:hypothetical protein